MQKWKFSFIAGIGVIVGAVVVFIIERSPDLVSESARATPNPAMMAMRNSVCTEPLAANSIQTIDQESDGLDSRITVR